MTLQAPVIMDVVLPSTIRPAWVAPPPTVSLGISVRALVAGRGVARLSAAPSLVRAARKVAVMEKAAAKAQLKPLTNPRPLSRDRSPAVHRETTAGVAARHL